MNRHDAARSLRDNHLVIEMSPGSFLFLWFGDLSERGRKGKIWWSISSNDTAPSDIDCWALTSWKSVLHVLRTYYPQRVEGQCDHEYASGARCTHMSDGHNHCKCCDEGCCFTYLCFTCQTKADAARRELVRAHRTYFSTFGVTPKFTDEDECYIVGDCYLDSYSGSSRGDREDFHADG